MNDPLHPARPSPTSRPTPSRATAARGARPALRMRGRTVGHGGPRGRRLRLRLSALLGLLVLAGSVGAGPPSRRQAVTCSLGDDSALHGLTGLGVHAEQTSAQLWPLGITDEWLRAQVLAALRGSGVAVLETADAVTTERRSVLVVRLQSTLVPVHGAFLWHLSLGVYERVATLGGEPDSTMAQIWAAAPTLGMTTGEHLRASLRQSLGELTAEFLRAWDRRDSTQAGRRPHGPKD